MTLIAASGWRVVALGALLWATALLCPAVAQRALSAAPETLGGILERAGPGDDIALAPGLYPEVVLRRRGNGDAPLVLRSADPENPARIESLTILDSTNVALRDLELSAAALTDGERPFRILDSREVDLRGLRISGSRLGPETQPRQGTGLFIDNTTDLALTGSTLDAWSQGIVISQSGPLLLEGNELHALGVSGILLRQVRDVTIRNNTIRDFHTPGGADAGVMIQFSTTNTEDPSRGILIEGNLLSSGAGRQVQGIIVANQLVDGNRGGPDLFYRNVAIVDNLIITAQVNAIVVGATDGVLLQRNTLVQNEPPVGWLDEARVWEPAIRIQDIARDVLVLGNVAHRFPEVRWQTDWVVAGNVEVQSVHPGDPGFYEAMFVGGMPVEPVMPQDFAARPGGVLDGSGIGASRLVDLAGTTASGSPAPQDALVEILRLEPDRGALVAYGRSDANTLTEKLLGGAIELGRGVAPLRLDPLMSSAFHDADAFRMTLRLRPALGRESAGEILRIHRNLVLGITDRGALHLDFHGSDARPVRLRSQPTPIYDDGVLDISIDYDTRLGLLTLSQDGEIIGEARSNGPTRARESWGLAFGNPFGDRKTFDGTIEAFSLSVRTAAPVADR